MPHVTNPYFPFNQQSWHGSNALSTFRRFLVWILTGTPVTLTEVFGFLWCSSVPQGKCWYQLDHHYLLPNPLTSSLIFFNKTQSKYWLHQKWNSNQFIFLSLSSTSWKCLTTTTEDSCLKNLPIQRVIPKLMLAHRGFIMPQSQQWSLPGIFSICSHILNEKPYAKHYITADVKALVNRTCSEQQNETTLSPVGTHWHSKGIHCCLYLQGQSAMCGQSVSHNFTSSFLLRYLALPVKEQSHLCHTLLAWTGLLLSSH